MKQTKHNQSNTPTASNPALRWAFACAAAVVAGVLLSYCWRVFYYLDARISPLTVTLGCAAGALACVGAAALVRTAAKDFALRGAACVLLCGLVFVWANPPMQVPDESQHYLRCDAISRGHLDFDAARTYPNDVSALYNAFPGAWVNAHTSQGMGVDGSTREPKAFSTEGFALKQYGEDGPVLSIADSFARYEATKDSVPESPVTEPLIMMVLPFFPQALGIAAARLIGLEALGQFYAGRIGNLLCYAALCYAALHMAKRYRPALLCVMLLPLSLFMAASMSYDATLLGCYYLMAALLTRKEWDNAAVAAYTAACVYVNVGKPYLNLLWAVLPLAALAKTAWQTKRNRWFWTAAMLAGAFAVTLFVEWYGRTFRVNYPAVIPRMGGEDVNGMAQLQFILHNPLRFAAVLVGTLYENQWFVGQLGLFGWKDLAIPMLNLTGPAVLLLGAVLSAGQGNNGKANPPLPLRTVVSAGGFCLLYAAGAMTAMYITYTPVSMIRVVGLQARYFLPVFLLLALLLAGGFARLLRPRLSPAQGETAALWVFAPYAAWGAVLLFQHYWIGPVFTIFT